MHALGPERVHGHGRAQGRIDPAGEPKHHAGKSVLLDVVSQPENAGCIIRLFTLLDRRYGRLAASPFAVDAFPLRQRHRFRKGRQLTGEFGIGVQDERGAIEDEFVLPPDLIEVDERQPALGDACRRNAEAFIRLAAPVRRAIGNEQQFRPGLRKALDDLFLPDVLADRDADPHAANRNGSRKRAGYEHPLLVEHTVVRKIHLESHGGDHASVEECISVEEVSRFCPGEPDQDGRPAVVCLASQGFAAPPAGILEGRLQDEILGRISGQEEFWEHDEVGAEAGGFGACGPRLVLVRRDVAQGRIELRERYLQGVLRHDCRM